MRPHRIATALCVLFAVSPAAARAQWTRDTSPVEQPGYTFTAPDGPESIVINPASMAFLESWGFGYVHSEAEDHQSLVGRGDGFYAASPLLFGISAGLSVDSVRPTRMTFAPERTMVSLALAWQTQNALSLGAAVRFLASGDLRLQGVTTLDLGASWRPVDWLGVSFAARDIVGPQLGGTTATVPRSFVLGTALRPLGDRSLTVDIAGVADEQGRIGGRVATEIALPYVGRLIAAGQGEGLDSGTPDLRLTAGLALDWGQYGVGGGVHVGDGLGDTPAWYVSGRFEGAAREGIPQGDYVLDVRVGGVGARGILDVVRRLEHAVYDDRVKGVLLRPRGSGIGLAYAQEIRMLVDQLRDAGKPVVCHLDDAAGSEWYACAHADRILLDPAGGIRLAGVASETYHLGEMLRTIGVNADFVRIGRWKSAIEQYMNARGGDDGRAQRQEILEWAYRRMVVDVARDRSTTVAALDRMIDAGPFLPQAALEQGLVDGLADEREMDDPLREAFGGSYPRDLGDPWEQPARWGNRPRIGVVVIDGTIVDGENVDIPLIGIHASGGQTVVRAIDRLAADPAVAAIVVRIDTGGGSVLASDQIYRAILRARRRKPVVASLGATAASGGYYIAAAAPEIWADPTTVTGSIGVWFGKVDFVGLGRIIGVELETQQRGAHAGVTSFFRPFSPDERALLSRSVREWYRSFLRRVARGRGMSVREVDALGRGRLWMGDQAIDNGLVDHLGGFGSALASARQAASVGPDVGFVVVPERPSTLLDYVFSFLGIGATAVDPVAEEEAQVALQRVAPELRAAVATVVTLRHLGAGAPLALMPEIIAPH